MTIELEWSILLKINITPKEKYKVITKNSVDGELFVIPEKFTCDNLQAAKLRDDLLEGIQDVISNKTHLFSGNLRLDMKKYASLKNKD